MTSEHNHDAVRSHTADDVFGRDYPHLVVKASAGTGKTHRLSARFLRLITHGADPAAILASTFTRAAAGEIRERVVLRIARAACGDQRALRDLQDDGGGLGIADYSAERAQTDLMRMLDALPRLRSGITTLDGFLASCVGMLSGELGIDSLSNLAAEDEPAHVRLRREAMRAALDQTARSGESDSDNDDESETGSNDISIRLLLDILAGGATGRSSVRLT